MKFKRKEKPAFHETCAPSDMAFLLIIYFLVIAGFNVNTGFLINLPAKDSTRIIQKDDLIRFNMDDAGQVIYRDEFIDIPMAKNIIGPARAANPEIAVLLTIDPQTRWQRVVSFVEVVQDLQVEAFSFTMRKEQIVE
jgi:biopolymer transport protein ExbD